MKDISLFCMSNVLSDITLIVGQESNRKSFFAHRLILCASSPVFRKMFIGEWATDKQEHELPDECPQAFEIVLKHIYTAEYKLSNNLLGPTIYSAKKYGLIDLEKKCIKYMESQFENDNPFLFYDIADFYEYEKLKKACLHRINCVFMEGNNLGDLLNMNQKALAELVEEQNLMANELQLLYQINLWSEIECDRHSMKKNPQNKRLVLNGIVNKIRFPLIDPDSIDQAVAMTGLLREKELFNIFRWFAMKTKPPLPFPAYPRMKLSEKVFSLERYQSHHFSNDCNENEEIINFTVDHDIYLNGIEVFHKSNEPLTHAFFIYINDVLYHKVHFANKKDEQLSVYSFKAPIPIQAGEQVEMQVHFDKSIKVCFGRGGQEKYQVQLSNDKVVTFHFNSSDRKGKQISTKSGQFPCFYFQTKLEQY